MSIFKFSTYANIKLMSTHTHAQGKREMQISAGVLVCEKSENSQRQVEINDTEDNYCSFR